MSHIFISYARKDMDFAQKIVAAVEAGLVRPGSGGRLRQSVLRSMFEGSRE